MRQDHGARASVPGAPARVAVLLGTTVVLLALLRCGSAGLLDPEPPIATPDDPAPARDRPVSIINVPMAIPLSALMHLVERAVPTRHGDLERFRQRPDSGHALVAYELERSRFRGNVVGDVARLSTLVSYRMRVQYPLPVLPDIGSSCGMGDERPKLFVALQSPISIDADWSLRTRARIAELRTASEEDRDRCRVTLLNLDITDDVIDGARTYLEGRLRDIDSLIAGVDTRTRFASWWNTLQEPVELGDSVWLSMEPEAIRRGPIRGTGDSITVQLALQSRPEIVVGARPPAPRTPLPQLDSGSVAPRLELVVDARAEYSTASRMLTELMRGRSFAMNGRVVRVDSVRAYGIGSGRLAMDVVVSGDLRGHLYLTGRPAIDRETGWVTVPDLELDVATRDIVLSTTTWFAVQVFREGIRDSASWPTTSLVTWLGEWLDRGLNRDISSDLHVTGVVDTVEIVDVAAYTDALRVRMSARGSASMYVR